MKLVSVSSTIELKRKILQDFFLLVQGTELSPRVQT